MTTGPGHKLLSFSLVLGLAACGSCARRTTPAPQALAAPPSRVVPADKATARPTPPHVEPQVSAPTALGRTDTLPGYDVDLPVEDMPRVVERSFPSYPQAAREAGIQGVVLTRALVLRDGSVGEVRVVQSIPGLDQAAVDCVRRWRFQPARATDAPLPAWVGIPIHFTLH